MKRNAVQNQVVTLLRRYGEEVDACELAIQRPSTAGTPHIGASTRRQHRRKNKKRGGDDAEAAEEEDAADGLALTAHAKAVERVKARIIAIGTPSSISSQGMGGPDSMGLGGGARGAAGLGKDGQRSAVQGFIYILSDDVVEPTSAALTNAFETAKNSSDEEELVNTSSIGAGMAGGGAGGVSLQLRARIDLKKLLDVYAPETLSDRPTLVSEITHSDRDTQRMDRQRRRSITGDDADEDDDTNNVRCHLELFLSDSRRPHVVLSFESPLQRGAVVTVLHRLIRMGGSFEQRRTILGANPQTTTEVSDDDVEEQKLSRKQSLSGMHKQLKTKLSIDPSVMAGFGGVGGSAFDHQELLAQMSQAIQYSAASVSSLDDVLGGNDEGGHNTKSRQSGETTTARLFDNITVLQHVLDIKSQQSELQSIGALVGTQAAWAQMASRTARLIEVVDRVDERIASYAKDVLSRKSIIEAIEHKNIELHRTERNLSILHKRMTSLQDSLSLSSDMSGAITALMAVWGSDRNQCAKLERERFLAGKKSLASVTNGIDNGIEDIRHFIDKMARDGDAPEILTPHDDLVDFFVGGGLSVGKGASANVAGLCAAMTKMGGVLHGAEQPHGHSKQSHHHHGGKNLLDSFPVLAVAQRRRYFVEIRRLIASATVAYVHTLLAVYERFVKWISEVTISSGKRRGRLPAAIERLSKSQRKFFELFVRFGFISEAGGALGSDDESDCLKLGDPVLSRPACLVLRHHNELHKRLEALQPILSTMQGVNPEGFHSLLRTYAAVMRTAYLSELRAFSREMRDCTKKVGWQQQRDAPSSSSNDKKRSSSSDGRGRSNSLLSDSSPLKTIGSLKPVSAAAGVFSRITGALSVSSEAAYIDAVHRIGGYLNGVPVAARAVREPSMLGAPPAGIFADSPYAGSSTTEAERAEVFQHLLESNEAGARTPMPGIFGGISLEGLKDGGGGGMALRAGSSTPQRSMLHSRSNSVPGVLWGSSNNEEGPSRSVAGRLAGNWIPTDNNALVDSNPFLLRPMGLPLSGGVTAPTTTFSYSTREIEVIASRSAIGSKAGSGHSRAGSETGSGDGSEQDASGALFISVPETHLSGVRLHKPASAKGSIMQASSLQSATSVVGGAIDTIRGKTGGGAIRPDIAFGLMLESFMDICLSEEIILRQVFGLGVLAPEGPPATHDRRGATAAHHTKLGDEMVKWIEDEAEADPLSCDARHAALREIFAGDALVAPFDAKAEKVSIGLGPELLGRGATGESADGLVDDVSDNDGTVKGRRKKASARRTLFGAAKSNSQLTERAEGWRNHTTSNDFGEDELDPHGVLVGNNGSSENSEDAPYVVDSDAISSVGEEGGGVLDIPQVVQAASKRERRLRLLAHAQGPAAKRHLLERNLAKEELFRFVSEVCIKKCDRVYIIAMVAMVEGMLFGGAPPTAIAPGGGTDLMSSVTFGTEGSFAGGAATNPSARRTLIHRSTFCLNILDKVYRKLRSAMRAFVTDQVSSILYSAHSFLRSPTALLSCFSRLPMLLLRVESTHHALDTSTRSFRHMDGFVLRMVDYCYNVLNQLSLVTATSLSSGGAGTSVGVSVADQMDGGVTSASLGLQLTPPSRIDPRDGTIAPAKGASTTNWLLDMSAQNPKRVLKGYLMQYRHNAFMCCVFAGLPRGARCRELLASRFAQATFARDHYEELYLTRLIFADAFPVFSRFISTAEDLFQTYRTEELNHNKSLSKAIVGEALKGLPDELKSGIASAAARIKRHFTADVRLGTTEESFHKALLRQTWQHFCRLVEGKIAFLEKRLLVDLTHLSGLTSPVSGEDVLGWIKKVSLET